MKNQLKKLVYSLLPRERLRFIAADYLPIGRLQKAALKYFWISDDSVMKSSGIKLNLGCGDKILDGFVNVDAVDGRRDKKVDVVSDLRALKFENDYADIVLSVHVIEHFYRWEAVKLLQEWKRVMKPGGLLVLECPNILSAVKFLKREQDLGAHARNSMWSLYGDPNWEDPFMCHKWGYTPQTLMELLVEVGFEEVSRQPAMFKAREPRDMRVTARKSL